MNKLEYVYKLLGVFSWNVVANNYGFNHTCIHNYTLYIYTYVLEEQVYEAPQLTLHMNMSDALRLLADIKE